MLGSAALLRDSRNNALARITWWASIVGSALGVFTCRGFFLDCFTWKTKENTGVYFMEVGMMSEADSRRKI